MSTPADPNHAPQSSADEGAEIKAERDAYLQALYALTRTPFTLDEADRLAIEQPGLTLEQIIEQLEQSQDD